MADLLYDYGLDEWRDWATGTYKWLVLNAAYTPNRTHRYVSAVTANEIAVSGYARATTSSPTRTVDTTLHRVTYDCADPNLGNLAAGATVGYLALMKQATDDTDSIMMALFDITDFATDGAVFQPVISASGVHYIDQA